MSRASFIVAGCVMVAAAVLSACDKKAEGVVAPAASSLAPSTAPPTSKVAKFKIDPKGTSSIDMPGPDEHIKAGTDGAAGSLDVDLMNVTNTRGEVKIDLSTLTMTTFKDEGANKKQTADARTWLEVADGAKGPLPAETKEQNRWAVYAIRSVDSASASDVTKVSPKKDGTDDVRTVTATTRGELLIHGHKVEGRTAELEIEFRCPAGGPADKPTAVVIKTKKPLRVTLAEHAVQPRDDFGKIAKRAFNLLGTKVADTADIDLALRGTPSS